MVTYLLKKSYRLKDYKEIEFNDLWGDHGVFTTMWLFDKPQKILFFDQHINNLIKSTKVFKVYKADLKLNILDLNYLSLSLLIHLIFFLQLHTETLAHLHNLLQK